MTPGVVILIFVTKILSVVLCGLFVRIQLAIHRGFDLSLIAIIAFCADVFIFITDKVFDRLNTLFGIVVALSVAIAVGAMVSALWCFALIRLARRAREPGYIVFLASLGFSSLVVGIIGVVRGPGLKITQTEKLAVFDFFSGYLPVAPFTAFALLLSAGLVVAIWVRTRTGFATSLLAQDRTFAIEIGVEPARVALSVGIVWGGLAAIVGCAEALLVGNTPQSGLSLFLLGAVAALLLPNNGLLGPVIGGIWVGAALVLVQFFVPPSWAEPAVLAVTFAIIAIRGIDRTALGLR